MAAVPAPHSWSVRSIGLSEPVRSWNPPDSTFRFAGPPGRFDTLSDLEGVRIATSYPDLVRESAEHDSPETDAAFAEAVDFAWPDVPVRVVAARDDRVFPSMLSIGDGLTLARRVK